MTAELQYEISEVLKRNDRAEMIEAVKRLARELPTEEFLDILAQYISESI